MAIFWYDALATVNGTGTYADPFNGVTSQPVADGDEVRIKSYSIDAMTDFTFLGNVRLDNFEVTMTDTSALEIGDLIMFDDTRTCVYITSKTATALRYYGQACSQFTYRTSITDGTFRKINPAYLSQVVNRDHHLRPSNIDAANTLYSDGWIDETTRVTDKSYMTIHTSIKDSDTTILFDQRRGGGNVIDFPCSCFMPSNGMYNYSTPNTTTYNYSRAYVYFRDNVGSTINIHSILHGNNSGRIITNSLLKDTTITIDYLSAYYGLHNHYSYNSPYDNCDVTINNMHAQATYFYNAAFKNNTRFTFRNQFVRGINTPMLYSVLTERMGGNFTVTFDGIMTTGNLGTGFTGEIDSRCTINITDNFKMFSEWGVNERLTVDYMMRNATYHYSENLSFRTLPIFNNFSTTFITPSSNIARIHNVSLSPNRDLKTPIKVTDMTVLTDSASANVIQLEGLRSKGTSYLFTDRITHETYEELSCPMRYGDTSYSFIVRKDTTKFNLVSPSYKFYLQTFNSSYNADFFEKVIKIPVTTANSTTEFTVTGYIWADVGLFAQDDLETAIFADNGDSIYTEKPIIADVEAGWTKFIVRFTPGFSQVAELRIRFKPQAGAKSFWLSDVEIL